MSEPTPVLRSSQSFAFQLDTCGLLEVFRNSQRASEHGRCDCPGEQHLLPSDGVSLVLSYLELRAGQNDPSRVQET